MRRPAGTRARGARGAGCTGCTGCTGARRNERAPRGRDGFTLLEVVLALGLLLFGVAAVIGLLSFGAALARTADLRTAAAQAADAVVADLEESLFPLGPDGEAGEPVAVEGRALPGQPGLVYSAHATANPEGPERNGAPLEYRVDVEIAWRAGGRRRTRRFTTLLLREVPFGERIRRAVVEYDEAPRVDPQASPTSPDTRAASASSPSNVQEPGEPARPSPDRSAGER